MSLRWYNELMELFTMCGAVQVYGISGGGAALVVIQVVSFDKNDTRRFKVHLVFFIWYVIVDFWDTLYDPFQTDTFYRWFVNLTTSTLIGFGWSNSTRFHHAVAKTIYLQISNHLPWCTI